MRTDRKFDETRTVKITDHYLMSPQGSVLIEMGNTKVICTASVEESTAKHLAGTGKGWVTAEYAMLPGSTGTRKKREKRESGWKISRNTALNWAVAAICRRYGETGRKNYLD